MLTYVLFLGSLGPTSAVRVLERRPQFCGNSDRAVLDFQTCCAAPYVFGGGCDVAK